MNEKIKHIARVIVHQSVKVEKDDIVFLETQDADAGDLLSLIHKECLIAGAQRIRIWWNPIEIQRNIFKFASIEQSQHLLDGLERDIKESQVYIRIKSGKVLNTKDSEHIVEYQKKLIPIMNLYSNSNLRRLAFYYPGKAMAKRIGKSEKATLNLTHRACDIDYSEIEQGNMKLKALMEKTNRVRVVGKGTDISFSIKNVPVISAHGLRNLPDGEVFTAPVKHSVNGKILFDIPTHYHGVTFSSIRLIVKKGKIISAKSANKNKNKLIDSLLNSHPHNRYFGEFAIGTNPYIKQPLKLTIFDEKLMGTIHFAIGKCYNMASNGNNEGTIHWDVIKNMKLPGSEIYFDGELVFKNGKILI